MHIDPAALKYQAERQKHNDQAEEHNRLRRVGQEALPGIRFQDAADVGRVFESKLKGDLTEGQWNEYTDDLVSSNKVTSLPSRAEYEAKPPFDDTYSGPRYKYGMRNRPYGFATAPKGAILMTYKPEDKEHGSRHGTIEYPFKLTKDDVRSYELVDFPTIKQQELEFRIIRNRFVDELEKRGFVLTVSNSEVMLADLPTSNGFIQAGLKSYGDEYHLTLHPNKLDPPIELDYNTPDQIDIERGLKWIDKEIAKSIMDIPKQENNAVDNVTVIKTDSHNDLAKLAHDLECGILKMSDFTREQDGKFTAWKLNGMPCAYTEGPISKDVFIKTLKSNHTSSKSLPQTLELMNEGFYPQYENAVLKNGDKATGYVIKEDNRNLFIATDKLGNEYETAEKPLIALNKCKKKSAGMSM
jgi:hypothetical protein